MQANDSEPEIRLHTAGPAPPSTAHGAFQVAQRRCWEERIDLLPARWQGTAAGLQSAVIHTGMAGHESKSNQGCLLFDLSFPAPSRAGGTGWPLQAHRLTQRAAPSPRSPVTAGVRLRATRPEKHSTLANTGGRRAPSSVQWRGQGLLASVILITDPQK